MSIRILLGLKVLFLAAALAGIVLVAVLAGMIFAEMVSGVDERLTSSMAT